MDVQISPAIFRAYDIRGIVADDFSAEVVYRIARALAVLVIKNGDSKVCIARDGRLTGPALSHALIEGLRDGGCDCIDFGAITSPMLYFATFVSEAKSGIVLTASHNPPEYNGLKVVVNHSTWCEGELQDIYHQTQSLPPKAARQGSLETRDVFPEYLKQMTASLSLARPLKIVLDCAHGIAGAYASQVFRALGCEVHELFCEVDGSFPAHTPDTSDLSYYPALIEAVKAHGADVGLGLDGDGDRLGIVSNDGSIVWPDRLMMLLAEDILQERPCQKIIFDVKCSQLLAQVIRKNGGEPVMSRTGHSLIKRKMQSEGCLFAGEMSGHLFFKDRWYGTDDGIYTGARLLEILARGDASLSERLSVYPPSLSTPELKVKVPDRKKFDLVARLVEKASFPEGKITTLDGLRVDFADGFGLVRASNTAPLLTLRFEGQTQEALSRISQAFKALLLSVEPGLVLTF